MGIPLLPPQKKKNGLCLNKRIDVIIKASAYLFQHFRKELALQQVKEWHAAVFMIMSMRSFKQGAFWGKGGGGGGGGISRGTLR